ncbi:MAG: translation factor Sua5 [Actinomycetia bacterium]|nr:translation factor Sua5 [Actinomycetes bacterium]
MVTRAVEVLREGGLVAFPTETVYGLGADATNARAVRRLFAVKGRPATHPVIAHLGAGAALDEWAVDITDAARALTAAWWPGPLTVVVRRRPGTIVDEITGGRDTVGLRVPDHPLALQLLDAFGGPVAAPSANRFGRVSPTTAADVRADLDGDVDLVLDGGPCSVGVESTIVDCTQGTPAILRVGGITAGEIEKIVGVPVAVRTSGEVAAPGTLASHYAPRARVELVVRDRIEARGAQLRAEGERVGMLAMTPALENPADGVAVLGSPADVEEYARVLYRRLREADALGLGVVLVVPPPDEGIGAAIRDRLQRASTR